MNKNLWYLNKTQVVWFHENILLNEVLLAGQVKAWQNQKWKTSGTT